MIANPIFINTFVVFVRLYWFEKRFQHIAQEARSSRSRSRTNTQMLGEKDTRNDEKGVNGRSIVVLHGNGETRGPAAGTPFQERPKYNKGGGSVDESLDSKKESPAPSDQDPEISPTESPQPRPPFARDITFADELVCSPTRVATEHRTPQQMSHEQQIAFLDSQRNPKDDTLRIPGPRDFDRGDVPKKMSGAENEDSQSHRSTSSAESMSGEEAVPIESDGHKLGDPSSYRNITIDDSNATHSRRDHGVSPKLKLSFRKTATNRSERTPSFERHGSSGPPRSIVGTFPRIRTSSNRERDIMPYLSWQPTIGRNSAFVDLTEEQREELGGIEYRSLKTLAIMLVCRSYALCRC